MNLTDKHGHPTRYGLACGYVRQLDLCGTNAGYSVNMCEQHGVIHIRYTVRPFDINTPMRRCWETATTMSEARRIFSKFVRAARKEDVSPCNQHSAASGGWQND